MFCQFGQKINATDYHVGTSQTYTNLEALRSAVASPTITWGDNDKIILHNDDNSLKGPLGNFNGKSITISGDSVTILKILIQIMLYFLAHWAYR
jgi:hypothetical protein